MTKNASTIINLEEPFSYLWKRGYLQTHPSGRKYVCLFNSNSCRTLISYARYLMSVKLGCLIHKDLTVDHINNDKTDDRVENLQLLSLSENINKEAKRYIDEVQIRHNLKCQVCDRNFVITDRLYKMKRKQTDKTFCSNSCSTKFHKTKKGLS
jgi:HNH endonuclease